MNGNKTCTATFTVVTVSVSATTPYNTTPNTNISFSYIPSTNTGSTECRLLDYTGLGSGALTSYRASSPIVYPSPNGVGAYSYYVQCRNVAYPSVLAISNRIIVNTACASGSDFISGSCRVRPRITATQTANGTISPAGTSTVLYGSNVAYTITANGGYYVASLVVDGSTIAGASTYTFFNATVNHTISPIYAVNTFAVINASPITITTGKTSKLTWSSNGTSCTGTNFNTGGAISGSVSVAPRSTTTYIVTCNGASLTAGQATAKVTVKKKPAFIEN